MIDASEMPQLAVLEKEVSGEADPLPCVMSEGNYTSSSIRLAQQTITSFPSQPPMVLDDQYQAMRQSHQPTDIEYIGKAVSGQGPDSSTSSSISQTTPHWNESLEV